MLDAIGDAPANHWRDRNVTVLVTAGERHVSIQVEQDAADLDVNFAAAIAVDPASLRIDASSEADRNRGQYSVVCIVKPLD
ncbi:hypothetical protein [Bradyrhizobium sp. USDA 3364]